MKSCSPPFLFGACSSLLPCPFELEVTHGADKLLFFTKSFISCLSLIYFFIHFYTKDFTPLLLVTKD